MFWKVASARDAISQHKCCGDTLHLRTAVGALVVKNVLCW